MIKKLTILTLLSLASPAAARDPSFVQPIDCELGDTCFIQRYMDHDPSDRLADFQCNNQSGDDHSGTDFALPTLRAMEEGVDVLSTAPGIVVAVRDDMRDVSVLDDNPDDITGRACGNGVLITHGNGWETQYCHLKQGSITVQRGQKVASGAPLGQVGLSGETSFPHVHLTVRKDGDNVDPFAPYGNLGCSTHPDAPLWSDDVSYQEGGIVSVGFAPRVPNFDEIKQGDAGALVLFKNQPIVLWGHGFGAEANDIMRLIIRGPGNFAFEQRVTVENARVRYFRAVGKRPPPDGWPAGRFRGTVDIVRDGNTIARKVTYVTVIE